MSDTIPGNMHDHHAPDIAPRTRKAMNDIFGFVKEKFESPATAAEVQIKVLTDCMMPDFIEMMERMSK